VYNDRMSVHLIQEIDRFLAEFPLSEHRFGFLAANNGRLVERLRKNRRIWPDTEQRVRKFMIERRKMEEMKREKRRRKAAGADQVLA